MSGYNGIPFMDMQYYYDTAEKKESRSCRSRRVNTAHLRPRPPLPV